MALETFLLSVVRNSNFNFMKCSYPLDRKCRVLLETAENLDSNDEMKTISNWKKSFNTHNHTFLCHQFMLNVEDIRIGRPCFRWVPHCCYVASSDSGDIDDGHLPTEQFHLSIYCMQAVWRGKLLLAKLLKVNKQ